MIPKIRIHNAALLALAGFALTLAPGTAQAGFEWVAPSPGQRQAPVPAPTPSVERVTPMPGMPQTNAPQPTPAPVVKRPAPMSTPAPAAQPKEMGRNPVIVQEFEPEKPGQTPVPMMGSQPTTRTLSSDQLLNQAPKPYSTDPADTRGVMKTKVMNAQPEQAAPRMVMPSDAPAKAKGLNINPYPKAAVARSVDTGTVMDLPPLPKMDNTAAVPPPVSAQQPAPPKRIAAPAPAPAAPQNFDEVLGFGSDMPLALALRQVVPAEYSFSFGDGVNAGYRVSWSGGKPWNEVVSDMVAPLKLRSSVSGKTVYIEQSHDQHSALQPATAPALAPKPAPAPKAEAPQTQPTMAMNEPPAAAQAPLQEPQMIEPAAADPMPETSPKPAARATTSMNTEATFRRLQGGERAQDVQ